MLSAFSDKANFISFVKVIFANDEDDGFVGRVALGIVVQAIGIFVNPFFLQVGHENSLIITDSL